MSQLFIVINQACLICHQAKLLTWWQNRHALKPQQFMVCEPMYLCKSSSSSHTQTQMCTADMTVCNRQSCQQCTSYMYTSPHHESACIAFLYVPLVPLIFSSSLGLAYEAILPKHGCLIKQLLIKAKVNTPLSHLHTPFDLTTQHPR